MSNFKSVKILDEDYKAIIELQKASGKTINQIIHDKLNDTNETKTESQGVNVDDSNLTICLYDLYDWIRGKQTFECPILQKYPKIEKEDMAKIYCKNCPRKVLTINYKKAKMNPPKTESWKSQRERDDFEPYRQESSWQNNPTSGREFDLDDKDDIVHRIARESLKKG